MGLMKNVDDFFKKTFLSSHKLTASAKASSGQSLTTEHTTGGKSSTKATLKGGDVFGVAIKKVEFAAEKKSVTVEAGLGKNLHGIDGLNAGTTTVFNLDGCKPTVSVNATYSGIASFTPTVKTNVSDFSNGSPNFNVEVKSSPVDNITLLAAVNMANAKGENAMNYGLDVAYSGDGFTGVVSTSGADIAGLACAASADVDASKDVRFLARAKYANGGALDLDFGTSKQIDADTFLAFHVNSNSDARVLYQQRINQGVTLGYGGSTNLTSDGAPEVFMSIDMRP